MFAIAVSLGCDLFDSAAYALYAREGRYMTENGTWRIQEMDYFPCTCPNCATETPKTLMEKTIKEREVFLAEHNLWVCIAELKRIKQAIRDGRLWELTEMRAHAHPALLSALKRVKNHKDTLETFSPSIKNKGFFYFSHEGLARPEITHYRNRLLNRYTPPANVKTLLLLPQTRNKPFHKAPEMKKIRQLLRMLGPDFAGMVHVAVFCAPFGVVPLELDEVYPLSQHETALPLDRETRRYVAEQVVAYIKQMSYQSVTMLNDAKCWDSNIKVAAQTVCSEKGIEFNVVEANKEKSSRQLVSDLREALLKQLSN
jgi:7-cyano-7-deazaguanine tRNA-ribosyltransferase